MRPPKNSFRNLELKTAPIFGPSAFSFDAEIDATPGNVVSSNEVTLDGPAGVIWPLCIEGDGSPELQINAGAWVEGGIAQDGDTVKARLTADIGSFVENVATLYAPGQSAEFSVTTGDASDPDATAFLAAAGISDPTISGAVEQLVADLKAGGMWTKLKAIYPFVGGSAAAHKWNLKNPLDTDGAYRLSFSGGWTHDANGVAPDGSSAYADTHFNTATEFSNTNGFMALYSRTAGVVGTTAYDLGNSSGADTNATILIARYNNGQCYPCFGTATYNSFTSSDGSGLFAAARTATPLTKGYKNGTEQLSVSDTVAYENTSLYLGASHKGAGVSYYGARQIAFLGLGDTLDGSENTALYSAVQAFQTTLGRQV